MLSFKQFLINEATLGHKWNRKPVSWDDVNSVVSREQIQSLGQLPAFDAADLWAINPASESLPSPHDRFENKVRETKFIVRVPGKGLFLVDTQGHDHVRYAIKIQENQLESINYERDQFQQADKKVHPVETQWHYPIMTNAGFEPETKTGTGFVRTYHYKRGDNHIAVTTGSNSDYWEDKNTGKMGYWKELESYLNGLTEAIKVRHVPANTDKTKNANTDKTKKEETYEEKQKRLARNQRARERRWRKTGVGDSTIGWMKKSNWL